MNVNEFMSTNVQSCHANTNLDDIAHMMWDHDCGAIPVVNDKNIPIGIVTDRDIAMAATLNHKSLWEIPASQIIQGQHLCCSHQEDPIAGCLEKMEQNGVRRIIVTNEDGTLSGILSIGDILAFTSSTNQGKGLRFGDVLEMLQHVSAHHQSGQGQVAAVQ